jgi:hypothetical protein
MKGGLIVYKCRRCGKENKSLHVPDATLALITLIHGWEFPKEWGCMIPALFDICHCDDGNMGVSDLIGVDLDK